MTSDAKPLLRASGLCKAYPGVHALRDVSMRLVAGSIRGIMGENGAGKSTLLKIITGAQGADRGELFLDGQPICPRSPLEAQRLGIGAVYQEVNLLPSLSVAENIVLGRFERRLGLINRRACLSRAKTALDRLGLDVDPRSLLGSHPVAVQQLVAMARAIDQNVRVLVLDEPTSSLDPREVARLFKVVRSLATTGVGVLFVTHFIGQVFELCDSVTVLRNGSLVAEHQVAALSRARLVADMIGVDEKRAEALGSTRRVSRATQGAKPVVETRGACSIPGFGPFDLLLRPGEVVGVAGLLGSGRTELARLVTGADRLASGVLMLGGRPVRPRGPRDAIRRGIALCPEDRRHDAIIPHLSVRENIVLALQARQGWHRRVSAKRQHDIARTYITSLRIATPNPETPVQNLSGGNQQKVILARWMATNLDALILDEPTRGIDVGAKDEIATLMHQLCAKNLAVLFISSELEEVARDSSRVVVVREGRTVEEIPGDEVSLPRIAAALSREVSDV